jgi:(1->4)-alpha-D-glucan 1-alpha-D-glucosylmutase
MNAEFKVNEFPDRNTEYFLYQTLLGAWPISEDRLLAYMEKAAREAKQQTSWTQQDKEFEEALQRFIERTLQSRQFVEDLEAFVERITSAWQTNSLAQTLLRYTAPGIPDTYQGSELWDLRLVDPDNRTAVDYEARQQMLNDLKSGMAPEEIVRRAATGLPKLWVTHKALTLRRAHPEDFGAEAEYTPLQGTGPKNEHLVAFLRGNRVATIVPRWPLTLGDSWDECAIDLPRAKWKNVLTGDVLSGGRVLIETMLRRFPVALLTREPE